MIKKICVAGAGTMGSGIALAAALNAIDAIIFDVSENGIEKAKLSIEKNLQFLLIKEKIKEEEKATVTSRIYFTTNIQECKADIIIEAIIENITVKESLYKNLAAINNPETIFASNTSSLSITQIQKNIPHPQRVAGVHFFNPAHVMKLVEIVAGIQTSAETIATINELCIQLKKVPVFCKDAPGFIVNRVARHFYLEAMHLVETQQIKIEDVDMLMENAGFKMGPFKLMDIIGLDINLAVSQSLYNTFAAAVRFKPAALQEQKVAEGKLGTKTGIGFYNYTPQNNIQ